MTPKLVRFLITAGVTVWCLVLMAGGNPGGLLLEIVVVVLMRPWEYPMEQHRRRAQWSRTVPRQRHHR